MSIDWRISDLEVLTIGPFTVSGSMMLPQFMELVSAGWATVAPNGRVFTITDAGRKRLKEEK